MSTAIGEGPIPTGIVAQANYIGAVLQSVGNKSVCHTASEQFYGSGASLSETALREIEWW